MSSMHGFLANLLAEENNGGCAKTNIVFADDNARSPTERMRSKLNLRSNLRSPYGRKLYLNSDDDDSWTKSLVKELDGFKSFPPESYETCRSPFYRHCTSSSGWSPEVTVSTRKRATEERTPPVPAADKFQPQNIILGRNVMDTIHKLSLRAALEHSRPQRQSRRRRYAPAVAASE